MSTKPLALCTNFSVGKVLKYRSKDSVESLMKDNSLIVLEALLQGHTIKLKDTKYVLVEDENTNPVLAIEALRFKNGVEEDILLGSDMSFRLFLKLCSELPFDEIREIAGNISLTNVHRERYKKHK